jgi:sugar lactone lactonase YvrE
MNHHSIVAALALSVICAGCSQGVGSGPPLGAVNPGISSAPTASSFSPGEQPSIISHPSLEGGVARPGSTYTNLYVANEGASTVTVYARGDNSVLRTISKGISSPISLAMSANGSLYVLNCCQSNIGSVTVYDATSGKLLRTISDVKKPSAMAVGPNGYIFVADNTSSEVAVYGNTGSLPIYTLTNGINAPRGLAVDSEGNLYVSNCPEECYNFVGPNGNVTVYSAGQYTLSRTISRGVTSPDALMVARNNYLYVANSGSEDYSVPSTVKVYPPGKGSPSESILKGLNDPVALALSPSGTLFVGNCGYFCVQNYQNGFVTAYVAGKPGLVRTITQGIFNPAAVAVGPSGYLFVANPPFGRTSYTSTVQVYAPGSKTLERTISKGISYPSALVFGP